MDDKLTHKPGTRLGAYEVVRLIGRGGMACIYEARHTGLDKRVAVKVLHAHLASSPIAAVRFEREGRAASRIRHPNVVEIFEVGRQDGAPYLVMELLEGTDLADYLKARGALTASEAVDVVLPAISGVAAAHAAGVVHRDLKPSNVYLAHERRLGICPKVVDFGISKFPLAGEGGLTETEAFLGTAQYMAPEHARSPKNADARSDQYALGAILYECVTGRRPFEGESTYDLLHAIVTAPIASPRAFVPELDPAFEAAILKSMSRDPAARYASVEELGHAIAPFASASGGAWWRSEFAASEPRVTSGEPSSIERTATISLLGTTLPEPQSRGGHAQGPVARRVSSITAAAVVVAAGLMSVGLWVSRGAAGFAPGKAAPAPQSETVTSQPARTEVRPTIDTLAASAVPVTPRAEAAPSVRVVARPAKHATNPPAAAPVSSAEDSSRVPVSQVSERPVERGFNGAPIIE